MLVRHVALAATLAALCHAEHAAIGGYTPVTQVTDAAALDLDLQTILERAGLDDITQAERVYKHGGHSQSYAELQLQQTPTQTFKKGTLVTGTSVGGGDVSGTLMHTVDRDTVDIRVQYMTSDVQSRHVDCQVGALSNLQQAKRQGCFADADQVHFHTSHDEAVSMDYQYNSRRDNKNARTIQGFSKHAATNMKSAVNGKYHYDYQLFLDFYGDADYADKWIRAAARANNTNFATGRGNADFSGMSAHGRAQAMATGASILNLWMAVIQKMEEAVDLCRQPCTGVSSAANCQMAAVHRLDQAAALYVGSLQGPAGLGEQGNMLYALAEKRSKQFRTAGYLSKKGRGTSYVNLEIIKFWFPAMQEALLSKNPNGTGQCDAVQEAKEEVVKKMLIPIVQSVLHNAWLRVHHSHQAPLKNRVNGATYTAALLPFLHDCHPAAASTLLNNMGLDSTSVNFPHVKKTLEDQYTCLGMSCDMVGGIWQSGQYPAGGEPCSDGWGIFDRTPQNPDDNDNTNNSNNNRGSGGSSSPNQNNNGGSSSSTLVGSPANDGDDDGKSGAAIFFIVVLVLGVLFGGLFYVKNAHRTRKQRRNQKREITETNIAAVSAVQDADLT